MSNNLIFITGATGFIGSQVVNVTLKAGHRVRLAVRTQEQITKLEWIFAAHADKLEFAVIPDITKPDAYNGGLTGVDYVFHLASPTPGKGSDFKSDYARPAVRGTESMLNAAKAEKGVKRVVLMSSVVALIPLGKINDNGLQVKEGSGDDIKVDLDMTFPEDASDHVLKYQASKILAHQASKSWAKEHQPHFLLTTLHPTYVVGPSLIQTSAEDTDVMNSLVWNSLRSEKSLIPAAWVDVRDVADAHLKALDAPVSETVTEFLLKGPQFTWGEVADFIKVAYPNLDVKLQPPYDKGFSMDTSQTERALGMEWRTMEEMVRGVLDQQLSFHG